MKVKILSLGCRLNQYEIESVSTTLLSNGYELIQKGDADFIVINSCVVTSKSEAKSRNLLNKSKKEALAQKVILTGCFAKKLEKQEQTVFLPNDYKYLIPQIIENWDDFDNIKNQPVSRFHFEPPLDASTTRVNLKIQDGCDNFCSYCIVPLVRGLPVSKDASLIKEEFKALLEKGYKEIVLTGVSIGKYENNGYKLSDLVESLLNIEGEFRLHLSSIDPNLTDTKLISLLKHPKMVKHLHLSLQSGSNKILKLMNRKYSSEDFLKIVNAIKKDLPYFNFTTDLICGFPFEEEEDHQKSLQIIKEAGFSHVHTFRYSKRPLTKAAEMQNQVKEEIKKKRSREIIDLALQHQNQYYQKFQNKESVFLGEKNFKEQSFGHNEYYLPIFISKKVTLNQFINIKLNYNLNTKQLEGEEFSDCTK